MAAIISMAVGFVGAAVGTAIGAAIGGTILGISAATIGAVIGAGVAGGLLSMARGGDFGKGFLVGAVGAGIGSFASSFMGGSAGAAEGVAGSTDATTSAAAGAVEGTAQAAMPLASDAATSAVGDIGTSAVAGGIEAGVPAATEGAAFSLGDLGTTQATSVPTEGGFSLSSMGGDTGAMVTPTPTPGLEGNMAAPTSAGFTDNGLSGMFDGASLGTQGGGLSNPASTSSSFGMGVETSGGLEGATQGAYNPVSSTPTESGFSLEGTMNKSDAWLGENLGMPKGSTGKLAMGGLDALMKNYQANKLERQVNKMKPLTFEEFKAQHGNSNDYRVAANQMAKGGRTGTLPVLLARMNENLRGKYAGYLPGAQKEDYGRRMDVTGLKTASLNNLFAPYAQNMAMGGTK